MTFSEENYLKTIYHLISISDKEVSTNAIAESIETKASSVTDMLEISRKRFGKLCQIPRCFANSQWTFGSQNDC